jgi:hypothetical protein
MSYRHRQLNDPQTGELLGALVPMQRAVAARHLKDGGVYHLAPWEDRSMISHRHEFAFIREAFKNLPERFDNEPWAASPEHLRKYCLIRTKWCNTQTFACGSKAEAIRWAQNLRPLDEYSIVTTEGSTVYRFTAMSQSRRAMGGKAFQKSKTDIIEFLEDLLQIERGTLEGQQAA